MKAALIVTAMLALVACGQVAVPASAGDYKLYEATSTPKSNQVAVIDTRAQKADRALPFGTASPDWRHLYSVDGSRLVDTDPLTGATLNTMPLPSGYWALPPATMSGIPGGLSQNGRWLVLEAWDQGAQGSTPTATHMLVIDSSFTEQPVRVELKGFIEFDAISNDGQRLYLVEYTGGGGYRVRVYDLTVSRLDPQVVIDKSDGNDAMAGVRLMGVPSRSGEWQYSVYARQNDGPFIHALNLDGNVSACIFLPGPGYAKSGDAFRWSLALSPDGSELYATNGGLGIVATVSVGGNAWPNLTRTAHIATTSAAASGLIPDVQAKELGTNSSVLTPDGGTLVTAGASGIAWVDTTSLSVRRTALDGWRVWSLGLSPDGQQLYVVSDSGMIAQVSMKSGAIESRFNPGAGYPIGLIRVSAPGV
ncbi:MAG TPA: hypothetical protein VJT78_06735 [Candidatus Dormibacteraeota bacterium]|nr:hypothetical protein [Candidatus Dormibacteraeota bacterium]